MSERIAYAVKNLTVAITAGFSVVDDWAPAAPPAFC
jgi:hypothetical protein